MAEICSCKLHAALGLQASLDKMTRAASNRHASAYCLCLPVKNFWGSQHCGPGGSCADLLLWKGLALSVEDISA